MRTLLLPAPAIAVNVIVVSFCTIHKKAWSICNHALCVVLWLGSLQLL